MRKKASEGGQFKEQWLNLDNLQLRDQMLKMLCTGNQKIYLQEISTSDRSNISKPSMFILEEILQSEFFVK